MKFEFSAGGIVIKRKKSQNTSDSRNDANQIFVLLCQHSQNHSWGFPKGLIGDHKKGEGKEETALREVREETGITAKIIRLLSSATYWYAWEGEKRKKTVYYYLMEYVSGNIEDHDLEMENVEWLQLKDVEDRLTFSTDKKVWEDAKRLI